MAARISLLFALATVSTLSSVSVGCQHVRNGIHNTAADALDIVRFDLSASFGTDMGAHVMLSEYAQLKSYSYEDLYRVGVGTRSAGIWEEERNDWWLGPLHSSNYHIRRQDVAAVTAALPAKMRSGRAGIFQFAAESRDEIGVGVHAFIVGARAGVRPLELVDFLANFIGLDLCRDNLSIAERSALRAAKRAGAKPAGANGAGAAEKSE